jgi:hypothetical protein
MPPPDDLVSDPLRAPAALGYETRVAPPPSIQPIAGAHIQANPHVADVSPLSSPFEAGLLGYSGSPLFQRSPSRGAPHIGGGPGVTNPLSLERTADVVDEAQAKGSGGNMNLDKTLHESGAVDAVQRQPIQSDADPVQHGVFSGPDGNLYHTRPGPNGTTATHIGAPGDGSI